MPLAVFLDHSHGDRNPTIYLLEPSLVPSSLITSPRRHLAIHHQRLQLGPKSEHKSEEKLMKRTLSIIVDLV